MANLEIKISVGGAVPPEGYQYWFCDRPINWQKDMENVFLNHVNDSVIVSVGRDSYKQVFQTLQKHNIKNYKIGIHSKTKIEDVQPIIDAIKENGWEEYIDKDKSYNGRYLLLTEHVKDDGFIHISQYLLANENNFIFGSHGRGSAAFIACLMERAIKQWGYNIQDFSDEQLEKIRWGFEHNLLFEKIRLYTNPAFTPEQMVSIVYGFCGFIEEYIPGGLNVEQVSLYANPEFDDRQMREIYNSFIDGLTIDQIRVFAKPEFSAEQMKAIKYGFKIGLSIEQVSVYATPNNDASKILRELERYSNAETNTTVTEHND